MKGREKRKLQWKLKLNKKKVSRIWRIKIKKIIKNKLVK